MGKRRANGEGSIYKRKDGRWTASAVVSGERRSFYGGSRQEVAEKLTAVLASRNDGIPVPREKQTVGPFITAWLETAKANIRPTTYVSYKQIVDSHIVPYLGKVRLARLGPEQVQKMLTDKQAAGLSPRTCQYIRAALRRALGQALKWGLVARNVATLVDPPRVERHEIRPLIPDEARALVQAAQTDRLGPLYVLALTTGMRQGELLGLRWIDLDFDRGTLRVQRTLHRIEGKFQLVEPKTAKSQRNLPLPRSAAALLKTHRAQQNADKLKMGANWGVPGGWCSRPRSVPRSMLPTSSATGDNS